MAERTEYEKACDRIKANAQKVDIIAEREAFEAWQKQCGLLPIDPRHHDPETGYRGTITGRDFDRWDAWLARAQRGAIEEIEIANNLLLLLIRKTLNPPSDFNLFAGHEQSGE